LLIYIMIICTLVAALPAGARELRTNDPPNKKSDGVRLKRVSERRGKRASSTRERSARSGT